MSTFHNDSFDEVVCLEGTERNDRLVDRVLLFSTDGRCQRWGLHCGVPQQEVIDMLHQSGVETIEVIDRMKEVTP